MPSGMAADWEVFSRDGGSYTRHTVPMDLESLSLRPRPGRGFSIGGAYGPAYRADQLHGAHHHNLPIFITASSEKSILEKVWEANQFIFGMFLLGSYQYVTNVQSMHGSDKLKDALLIAFSILWCLLGIGFHLHFYSRNSEIRQKICSFILTAFTVMFSVLVTIHISMLLHSKKIAEAGRIIKLVFVVSVHVAIKIWFECNLGERISGWWSGCPVLPLSSAPGDVTRDNAYRGFNPSMPPIASSPPQYMPSNGPGFPEWSSCARLLANIANYLLRLDYERSPNNAHLNYMRLLSAPPRYVRSNGTAFPEWPLYDQLLENISSYLVKLDSEGSPDGTTSTCNQRWERCFESSRMRLTSSLVSKPRRTPTKLNWSPARSSFGLSPSSSHSSREKGD